ARFVWKVIALLLIAGVAGTYYIFSLYESFRWAKAIRRGNAWFGLVLVIAAIVAGFLIVGSPAHQRSIRFDQQRVSNLSNIQWQVVSYWQQKGKLPAALADLNDSLSGVAVPKDPETGASYEYSAKAPSFRLCAAFDLASIDTAGR